MLTIIVYQGDLVVAHEPGKVSPVTVSAVRSGFLHSVLWLARDMEMAENRLNILHDLENSY